MKKSLLLLSVLLMTWGQNVGAEQPKKPKPNEENRVYTLNKMGAMSLSRGKMEQDYLKGIRPNQKVIDIGCAYGESVKAAAAKGAQVWANDLDERHLQILKEEVENENYKDLIHYAPGDFPHGVILESNTFDKALIGHVLHFFDGEKIEQALTKAWDILKPEGEIYILVTSPYMKVWQSCLPDYEKRKNQGEKWPGYFTDMWERNSDLKNRIPQNYHLLELDVLEEAVKRAGFEIVRAEYEPLPYQSARLAVDGREYVTIIAKKPSL